MLPSRAQDFLALFGDSPFFTFSSTKLVCQTYQAVLWGPDVKRVLDPALGADWHVYERLDDNPDRRMTYVMCFTPGGRYLRVVVRCVLRAFYCRSPEGAPTRHSLCTLTVSFRPAHSRRAPVATSAPL